MANLISFGKFGIKPSLTTTVFSQLFLSFTQSLRLFRLRTATDKNPNEIDGRRQIREKT